MDISTPLPDGRFGRNLPGRTALCMNQSTLGSDPLPVTVARSLRAFASLLIMIVGVLPAKAIEPTRLGHGHWYIDKPGVYELTVDEQNVSGEPFLRLKPGVDRITIMLRGRNFSDPEAGREASGILGEDNDSLTIVGRGFALGGYRRAVDIRNSSNVHIEGVIVRDAGQSGIAVSGDRYTIINNTVMNVGGYVAAKDFPQPFSYGIEAAGTDGIIKNNTIRNVFAPPGYEAVGLSLSDSAANTSVTHNTIVSATIAPAKANGDSGSYGIWVGGVARPQTVAWITHNLVTGWGVCFAASSPTRGQLDQNALFGCTAQTGITGVFVVGDN